MRWWRRHAGVRARSTFAAAAVVALTLGTAMVGGYWSLRRALTNAAVDAVTARSDDVTALIAQEGARGLEPDRQPVFGEVIQVLDGSGQVVAAAPPSAARLNLAMPLPVGGRAQVRRIPALPQSGADEPYILVARSVRDGRTGRPVVVVVGRSVAGLSETVGAIGKIGLFGAPLLVLITAGAVYVFTGRALAPVEQMRRQVRTITARRLSERVPVPQVHDEIGRLAQTMNDMLASLESAHGAQQRFVADAGHELRSPLATIVTTLEVARTQPDLTPAQSELLDGLSEETTRMGRLVEDLLLLARADEHGLRLRAEDVDLDDLVENEARRLRTGSDLKVTVHTAPARVSGDRDRLAQVVRNLVDNAHRHAAGQVLLEVCTEGATAVVRVEDDGPGIAAQDRLRVFDRFVRLDASRQRGSGGSGLGLAIVKEIVTGHGGTVALQPGALGGTRAEVRLPYEPPD